MRVAEREDPAIRRDEPVAPRIGRGRHADDWLVQRDRARRAKELSTTEGEDAAIGRDLVVTAASTGHADDRASEYQVAGRAVERRVTECVDILRRVRLARTRRTARAEHRRSCGNQRKNQSEGEQTPTTTHATSPPHSPTSNIDARPNRTDTLTVDRSARRGVMCPDRPRACLTPRTAPQPPSRRISRHRRPEMATGRDMRRVAPEGRRRRANHPPSLAQAPPSKRVLLHHSSFSVRDALSQ